MPAPLLRLSSTPDRQIRLHGRLLRSILLVGALAVLAACSRKVEQVEEIRPVRVLTIAADTVDAIAEFPGEVRARYESRLGFRVAGKIVARKVEVGSVVRRGQVLMQLDPQDLQLAQRQADAALKAALSNRELAAAELRRYQELHAKNFVSQAVLDAKQTAYQSAASSYDQAQAALRNQANQTGYADLLSDVDGVVTAIDAEAGQVVAAGTPVASVAKSGDMDVLIGVPENQVENLRRINDVWVRLWANPQERIAGKVREVSPVADAATRTYAFKVALPDATPGVRLGMTAYVAFIDPSIKPQVKLPLSALYEAAGKTSVWLVENGAVKLAPVTTGGHSGNEILISDGLRAGQVVVTAGVNLLKPGQKVSILGAAPQAAVKPVAAPAVTPAAGSGK